MIDLYNLLLAAARLRSLTLYPKRWAVFMAYAKIKLRKRWFALTKQNPKSAKVLNFEVTFFDYATFAYLFEEIFVNGTYAFKARAKTPFIIDAGSNIGLSVLFFKWLYPTAHILAFEPDHKTFELLRKNVHDNQLQDVRVLNFALSDVEGFADFRSEGQGSLGASLVERGREQPEIQRVKTKNLSRYIDRPVDFLKMDIEGAEGFCLTEVAEKGRLREIAEMVVECHHNLPRQRPILSGLLPLIENHDFNFQIRGSTQATFNKSTRSQDVLLHIFQSEK